MTAAPSRPRNQPLPLTRTCAHGHENGPDDWYTTPHKRYHASGQRTCKRCQLERMRAYRLTHVEQVRARQKRHRESLRPNPAPRPSQPKDADNLSRDSLGRFDSVRPMADRDPLTKSEATILGVLASQWPLFVAPDALLPTLGYAVPIASGTLAKAHISNLRRKGWPIRSRRGYGYRYQEAPE